MNLTPKIQKAIDLAAVLHQKQKRKGEGLPYIVHPYSVAFILSHYTEDEDIIVAGLLHDVLEDVSWYSELDMEKDFGERVTRIIKEVSESEDFGRSEAEKRRTWRARKREYLENLRSAGKEALMVCAADKIHNLISVMNAYQRKGEKVFEKFNAPIKEKIWFYGETLKILKEKLDNPIV